MTNWWLDDNECLNRVRGKFQEKFGSVSFENTFTPEEKERIIQAVTNQITSENRDETDETIISVQIVDKLSAHLHPHMLVAAATQEPTIRIPAAQVQDSGSGVPNENDIDVPYIMGAIDQAFTQYRLLPDTDEEGLRRFIVDKCVQRMETLIHSGSINPGQERQIIASEIEKNLRDNVVNRTDIQINFPPKVGETPSLTITQQVRLSPALDVEPSPGEEFQPQEPHAIPGADSISPPETPQSRASTRRLQAVQRPAGTPQRTNVRRAENLSEIAPQMRTELWGTFQVASRGYNTNVRTIPGLEVPDAEAKEIFETMINDLSGNKRLNTPDKIRKKFKDMLKEKFVSKLTTELEAAEIELTPTESIRVPLRRSSKKPLYVATALATLVGAIGGFLAGRKPTNNLENKLQETKTALTESQSKHKQLDGKYKEAQKTIEEAQKIQKDLDQKKREFGDLSLKQDEYITRTQGLERQLEEKTNQYNDAVARRDKAQEQLAKEKELNDKLADKLVKKGASQEETQKRLIVKNEEYNILEKLYEDSQAAVEAARTELTTARNDYTKLEATKRSLEEALAKANKPAKDSKNPTKPATTVKPTDSTKEDPYKTAIKDALYQTNPKTIEYSEKAREHYQKQIEGIREEMKRGEKFKDSLPKKNSKKESK